MTKITVNLGEKSYPINIGGGLLKNVGDEIKSITALDYAIVITDDVVEKQHLQTLNDSLLNSGITPRIHIVKNGEGSKSLSTFNQLLEDILEQGIERNTVLIALGGGVIGDLSGFVAGSLLRGIQFVQIPTTLLAQVDSSVGGKTGINSKAGKNLIGCFYQPKMVIIDTDTLSTLDKRQVSAGYAEVIKYGLIKDKVFFDYLQQNDNYDIAKVIKTSCETKADIVAQDEKETGVRALLNLGHTYAHSIERFCNYDGTVLHGEAVAIGMVLAYKTAINLDTPTATENDLIAVIDVIKKAGLPTSLSDIKADFDKDQLFEYMYKDKKVVNGQLKLVLPNGIGDAYTTMDVSTDLIKKIWGDA
ncbi:MAG: 3-dehydroquinate synthase [Alphaproteobacteria bacterium]